MATYTLDQFVQEFSNLKGKIGVAVQMQMHKEVTNLLDEFRARSPVDEGIFKRNWKLTGNSLGDSLASYSISNLTPYGGFLDEGIELGKAPWYFPRKSNLGPVSKSGKLRVANGRVWAGGRSPSGFVGNSKGQGITDSILMMNERRLSAITKRVTDSVLGAL